MRRRTVDRRTAAIALSAMILLTVITAAARLIARGWPVTVSAILLFASLGFVGVIAYLLPRRY